YGQQRETAGMKTYTSLRWSLAARIVGGGVLAALIAAAGFTWFDLHRYWQRTDAEVSAIANVMAGDLGPAITRDDLESAAGILSSVRADALIRDAMLYDIGGGRFAGYHRPANTGCPALAPDGMRRQLDTLVVARPVNAGTESLGP